MPLPQLVKTLRPINSVFKPVSSYKRLYSMGQGSLSIPIIMSR